MKSAVSSPKLDSTTVLVTGAAGFIGSHLSEKLIQLGANVVGLDSFDPFYPRQVKERNIATLRGEPRFSLIEGDVRDPVALREAWDRAPGIRSVIHLAGLAGVRPSLQCPTRYFSVNTLGTVQLLDFIRQLERKPVFLLGSSSSVYGNDNPVPFAEKSPVNSPLSPYAASKIQAELVSRHFNKLYGVEAACLRFFTAYGPRQRPDLMIAKFSKAILSASPIEVYGDGSTSRDYTYIDDLVAGIVGAMRWQLAAPRPFEIFNLGNSSPISLSDAVRTIEREAGTDATIVRLPEQPGEMTATMANIEKARAHFGYTPATEFEEGVKRYFQWLRKNEGLGALKAA